MQTIARVVLVGAICAAAAAISTPASTQQACQEINYILEVVPMSSRLVGVETGYCGKGPAFVLVHEDEQVTAADTFTGRHITLKQSSTRRVQFGVGGTTFSVDPALMFAEGGIRQSLEPRDNSTEYTEAFALVRKLGERMLHYISGHKGLIVELHNHVAEGVTDNSESVIFTNVPTLFEKALAAGYKATLLEKGVAEEGTLTEWALDNSRQYLLVSPADKAILDKLLGI